jgi:uncharacterized protein YlxW (UPF0749 family)
VTGTPHKSPHRADGSVRRRLVRLPRGKALRWKLAVPIAAACAGLLAITSMINARGTDLRGGRNTDLIGVVSEQRSDVRALQRDVQSLQANVDVLSESVQGTKINQLRRQVTAAEAAASVLPMRGPGLKVTLDDAPPDQPGLEDVNPNVLVVHQQDIQAVVNALWAGGAEGISIENQRIISTTGIKCVGNTVILQQIPYAPPYRIRAVGDPLALMAALQASKAVTDYVKYTAPPYNLGYEVTPDGTIRLPKYDGPLTMKFAKTAD